MYTHWQIFTKSFKGTFYIFFLPSNNLFGRNGRFMFRSNNPCRAKRTAQYRQANQNRTLQNHSLIYIFARSVYYGAQYTLRTLKANFVFNLLKYHSK